MTPTANLGYQSFFQAQLTAGISASDLTIPLDVVPTPSEGFLVLESTSASKREIIYYTSKTVNSVVCPAGGRGYDGTTAQSHLQNSAVIMAPVAAMFSSMRNLFETTPQGWTPVTQTVSSVTYNGQRSYSLTMSADVSATLSPGMRVRTTRTVSAPTQCTSLNGTTQYYSRASASVTGMTFTGSHTTMAWVKLTSYPTSDAQIIGRTDNSTGGFSLCVKGNGQVRAFYGGTSTFTSFESYQSLPLNKWIHIAASVNAAAKTVVILIDGVSVPYSSSTSAATSLVQTSNLELGRLGANYFPGKIAQAAIFSTNVATATIQGYISQGLSGTETNLVSAYSFNGNANDLNTTNANNLTANGSAVATNADSPFAEDASATPTGTTDFGIVTNVATTTLTVQVPEGCAIPTSGGVSAISYSTQASPYGFTVDKNRWAISSILRTVNSQVSPTANTWYNLGSFRLSIPTGAWSLIGRLPVAADRNTGGAVAIASELSTSASATTSVLLRASTETSITGATGTANFAAHHITGEVTLATDTIYYGIGTTASASINTLYFLGDRSACEIRAIPSGI